MVGMNKTMVSAWVLIPWFLFLRGGESMGDGGSVDSLFKIRNIGKHIVIL